MPSPKPGVPHKKAGRKAGVRDENAHSVIEKRKTNYPKADPNYKSNISSALPRPEPRKIKERVPMPAMDERSFLQNSAGEYLHMSGEGTTRNHKFAFWGTDDQIKRLIKRNESLVEYKRVPYRTVVGIGVAGSKAAY